MMHRILSYGVESPTYRFSDIYQKKRRKKKKKRKTTEERLVGYLNVTFGTKGAGFKQWFLVCNNSLVHVHARRDVIECIHNHILSAKKSIGVNRFCLSSNLKEDQN